MGWAGDEASGWQEYRQENRQAGCRNVTCHVLRVEGCVRKSQHVSKKDLKNGGSGGLFEEKDKKNPTAART